LPLENAIAVNPAHAGVVGALDALTKGTRLVLVRCDSWSEENLVELAKAARSHESAAVVVGHGRLHEDFSVTGLLKKPRVLGPVAIRADRWPAMDLDRTLLRRDPVLDHGASWVLAFLCAAFGGEVASTDAYGYSDPWHYDSAGYLDLGTQFAIAVYELQEADRRSAAGDMAQE